MQEYKDVYRIDKDGTRYKWKRLPIEQIPLWIERAKIAESQYICTTIQTFFQPNQPGEGDKLEEYSCDFYADFDGDKSGLTVTDAHEEIKRAVLFFDEAGLEETDIRIWFTGGRGFHLVVPGQVFGAKPSTYLHKLWRLVAKDIKAECGLETLDETVYRKRCMWRVEGAVHSKTGLYKIPLTVDEVLHFSLDEIKRLAERPKVVAKPTERPALNKICGHLYSKALEVYGLWQKDEDWEPADITFDEPPPCITAILEQGAFELGQVNMIAFRLAAYFKSQNIPMKDAIELMSEWVLKLTPEVVSDFTQDGSVDYGALQKQAAYTTNSVYSNPRYGFSCAGIRQIPQIQDYCTEECRQTIVEETQVDLFDAFNVQEYLGKKLRIEADAIGRIDEAYAIPESITVECKPAGTSKCAGCPLYASGTLSMTLTARNWTILDWLKPSNTPLTGRIGSAFGMPPRKKCADWRYKVKERNVEIIRIAPRVSNNFESAERYTRKPAYYLGFGLELNQGYAFTGYAHIDQKKNVVNLVLDKAEPLADTLSEFEYTEEMKKRSTIFRPKGRQTLEEKHGEIIKSLNYHIVRCWGRDYMIRAIDLAFHSPNVLPFQRELIRGWLNVLVIGDTGQGKSKAAESLMRHYNLGFLAAGESAKRTGLLYTIPVKEGVPPYIVWGVLPRYDRRLVFIDELKELIKSGGFGELTQARSSGIVTVTQTVFGQAHARTRLVMMTNTASRKPLGSYGYGVLSILELIPDQEDIRRFDYAIGVASSEIDDSIINIDIEDLKYVEDVFESEICHNHILWVWNLKPEDIEISRKVEKKVLESAYRMCGEYVASAHLVEPGDFRHKIMRTAAAIAARMDCRNKDRLIVTPECVDYAEGFINTLYKSPALDYYGYSEAYAAYMLTEDELEKLINVFRNQFSAYFDIARWLAFNTYTKTRQLSAVTGLPEGQIRDCLNWCSAYKLLDSTSKGSFVKTELGGQFFKTIVEEAKDEN